MISLVMVILIFLMVMEKPCTKLEMPSEDVENTMVAVGFFATGLLIMSIVSLV